MPARPNVPNVLKVEFNWTQDGIPAANIKYVLYSGGPPSPADCNAIALHLEDAMWGTAMGLFPSTTEMVGTVVTDLTSDTGSVGTSSGTGAGTASSDACPANCCVLVDHTIARRYRGGHPRSYYPPPAQNGLLTPSTWQGSIVTDFAALEAAYALVASTYLAGTTQLVYNVNVSYVTGGAPRVVPVVDQITGSVVSGIIRTQRRRLTASSY